MSAYALALRRSRPAFILWRHVILELIPPTVLGFSVFTFLMLMRFLLRISRLWIQYGAELSTVLWAIVYSLPFIVALTMPMGLLVGALIAFGRMSSDFEIVALRASGVSLLHLLPPVLIVGGVLWVATGFVYMVAIPWGNTSLREMQWATITQRAFSNEFKPRVFNDDFPGLVLYIEDIVDDGREWRGVFAAQTDQQPPTIIRAERAFPQIDDEQRRTSLLLENGTVIASAADPRDVTLTRFDRQFLPIWSEEDTVIGELGKDGRSMTVDELDDAIAARQAVGDPAWDLQVEIHKKYALPFACIVMAIISLPLGISTQRQTTAVGFAMGTAVIVVYYFFAQNGEQQADVGAVTPWLGMWAGNIVLGVAGLVLLWKKSREVDFGIYRRVAPAWEAATARITGFARQTLLHRPARRRGRRRGAAFPRTLDRYVLQTYVAIFVLTFSAFIAVFGTGTWIDKASYVQNPELIPEYMKFQIWQIIFDVVPMAAVVTVLATFSLMTRRGEIVATLAGGVSLQRLMLPILVPAVALTAAQYALQDYVLPHTTQQAEAAEEAMHPTGAVTLQRDQTWVFSEGERVFHFERFLDEPPSFLRLRIYYLADDSSGIGRMEFADRATWNEGVWEGHDGWRRYFVAGEEPGEVVATELEQFRYATLPIGLSPSYFSGGELLPSQMSIVELRQHIELLRQRGYETGRALVDLHMKIATPAIVFVMTLVGVPFAFRMGRHGTLTGVGIAIALVAVYWIAFGVFQALGYAGQLPPPLAAWAPHLLFISLGLYQAMGVRT